MKPRRRNLRAIAIFCRPQSWTAIAFARDIGVACLRFEPAEDGSIVDGETKSRWDIFGRATTGPLAGHTLPFIRSGIEEWYAWAASHPGTEIF